MDCVTCVPPTRLAKQLNVRPVLIYQLIKAGHVKVHKHDDEIGVTQDSVNELKWRLAMAKADAA